MGAMYWQSPDKIIRKSLLSIGDLKIKPCEGTECKLKITDSSEDLTEYCNITIGDVDSDFGRQFEICVTTLFVGEISKFVVTLEKTITFTLELLEMKFNGFLYEWDYKRKYEYAQFQNERGKVHFSKGNIREAGFKFNKGIKILCSISINAEESPDENSVKNIGELKAILYNNLGSCFFKKEQWPLVIEFCDKVFLYDKDNVKALYRAAIAYIKDRNFEKADKYLQKVLKQQPANKSAVEHHKFVQIKLSEANKKCDIIAKRMISDIIKT